MRIRFQADADLDARIIRGLRRMAPEVDIRTALDARLTGLDDPAVLSIAKDDGRVLISQDRRTMPAHFARFIQSARSPGIILVRRRTHISVAIDDLVLIWATSEIDEWIDRLIWIPL